MPAGRCSSSSAASKSANSAWSSWASTTNRDRMGLGTTKPSCSSFFISSGKSGLALSAIASRHSPSWFPGGYIQSTKLRNSSRKTNTPAGSRLADSRNGSSVSGWKLDSGAIALRYSIETGWAPFSPMRYRRSSGMPGTASSARQAVCALSINSEGGKVALPVDCSCPATQGMARTGNASRPLVVNVNFIFCHLLATSFGAALQAVKDPRVRLVRLGGGVALYAASASWCAAFLLAFGFLMVTEGASPAVAAISIRVSRENKLIRPRIRSETRG